MRLAVPLFGKDVSPRFCFAERLLVVDLDEEGNWTSEERSLAREPWTARLHLLSKLGVQILLCGGINRHYLPLAESLDIRVIWGLRGDVKELIGAFQRNELAELSDAARPGFRGGRRQGRWGKRGR